jgi:uncharacterized protein YacL
MQSIYLLVIISIALAVIMYIVGTKLAKLKANIFFIVIFATMVGLLIGTLAYLPLSKLPGIYGTWLPIVFYILSVSASVWLFIGRRQTIEDAFASVSKVYNAIIHLRDQLPVVSPDKKSVKKVKSEKEILVDTSVLIDGRIEDIARTGFVPGRLIVPKFILLELQNIADSDDQLRRSKGRRGLDVLQSLKTEKSIKVESIDADVPEQEAVDSKLVHLARMRGADVLTTDYNLNKVAKIEGVTVLNINELSQALRPVIIPGEMMELKIVQAGKEKHQGVGYLPDGTMIVVEEGDRLVGKSVNVEIKRVLQTAAGKMFFATLKNTR